MPGLNSASIDEQEAKGLIAQAGALLVRADATAASA